MADDHSPVYKTMRALEDQGLHVAVAFHATRPPPGPYPGTFVGSFSHEELAKIDRWAQEACDAGASWVSVIVVSDRPAEERLTHKEEAG